MTMKEQCLVLHEQGVRQSEIARIVGVTRQRVSQICGTYCPGHFRKITEKECVYPNWRNFMNENKISRAELLRRMGLDTHSQNYARLSTWMRGRNYPVKQSIDMLLSATGLTYEQLFYRDGGN